ncbi:hypothetical protein COY05_04735 [Candidatus Peregrinibacteria bacterium CG_4_10_14_0_2_um_filter_38_24]|nr:MAG: hypothetical protein COY05_04735 [Candidatus Peregrinibacteria bacterium CG_4_10_14_0_2_um_filter_38_24]PJC39075.1 MAG: hypothetical protein CO044_01610 [Candidatus Peregrinibacteria bacterium CG_4_9_14_0_2_um_filter_38_9]
MEYILYFSTQIFDEIYFRKVKNHKFSETVNLDWSKRIEIPLRAHCVFQKRRWITVKRSLSSKRCFYPFAPVMIIVVLATYL